ncbi:MULTISPECIES: ferritin-like domain-containing protein [Arcobacteraceae]|uniref:DUF2202 domain-containing protein n=3 Tax=Arcobacteraceae TaxID=2808963 RepID=A0ABX2YE65_9BACT|nr:MULTISPECIES: ferritin family protein [Arcobacteraceae]OCL90963.1 hypothetical protein AAX25_01131 [Aliarcobacter thereius]OCL93226.1 hypothetical protein AAX28_00769 [Arcobacter porcinus]OCL96208.1 hypothetical protein AA347_01699 [Aliarcobacter thereius LMG 24486]QBF15827.1 ferritin-like protein (DUF2202 domain) [Aliarcobacter thereius LMG 24486]TLS72098.1 DUF2202 domain-containing protein [Aliarcobacter thereius]
MAVDYNILTSKKIDENSNIPIRDQILQIAVYDEFKAYEIYTKVIEKFGNINPFLNIKEAEAIHYSVLIQLMQKYNIEVPINDLENKISIPESLIECYELGVAGEINNIALYNYLLSYAQDSDIIDTLYQLQAASYNNHLPAFRSHVQNYYNNSSINGFNQEKLMQDLAQYQEIYSQFSSGNLDENSISNLLSKLNFNFIGGALSGGALIAIINQLLSSYNKQNQDDKE